MCSGEADDGDLGTRSTPAVTRRALLVASGLAMGLAAFGLDAVGQAAPASAAGTYLRPCGNVPISDSWQGHKNRNPPSAEPGTDYAVAKGTPVLAATDGVIVDRKDTNSTATGRYLALRAKDGNYIRYLHLNSSAVPVGATVTRGQVIAHSGASGFNSDNGYGPHVHVSLWFDGTPNQLGYANTVDFEQYVASPPLEAVAVYRFWSPSYRGHFFTTSVTERDQVIARWPNVWQYEGQRYTAFQTQVAGTIPLYRFWSPRYSGHFYTADTAERDSVIATWSNVWTYEGVAYYVYPVNSTRPDTVPVARFWSSSAAHHFYTADAAERDAVMAKWPNVWAYEGDRFRVPAAGIQ